MLSKVRAVKKTTKALVFIAILIVSDQAMGRGLRYLYFHQKTGVQQALTKVFSDVKTDILIFGNSRAQHHYASRILADSLKMSCFNAGQDGGHSILLPYAQMKVITERYSPKIIILEFHPNSIVHYPNDYDRLSILLPYYKEYPELRPFILLRSPLERVKLMSAIYPFNSKLNTNLMNIIRFYTSMPAIKKQDYEGYIPIKDKVMNIGMLKPEPEIATQSVVDPNMVNALKNIIRLCKEKNISLFIVSSPTFHTVNEKQSPPSSASKLSLEIIRKENATYLDFSYDPLFIGKLEWFVDQNHLNDKGAKLFTSMLAERLKSHHN